MKEFYLQGKDLTGETGSKRGEIRFHWNITYSCNYRCRYCFFDGKWEEYGKRTVFLEPSGWEKNWRRIFEVYGSCFLVITGGEPFTYPGFIQIIRKVSAFHRINISTNGSGNMENFAGSVSPERVSLTFSFHPGFNTLKKIISGIEFVREKGFKTDYINLCAYPPFIPKVEGYLEEAAGSGLKLKLIPFCGEFEGKRYPESYSDYEKEVLGMDGVWEDNVTRKGSLCCAGYRTALIFPDGKTARCGQIGEKHIIGDFFSDKFRLLEEPLPCEADICPCLEAPEA